MKWHVRNEVNKWRNEWMNDCLKWMIEWINEICQPHLSNVLWHPQFFTIFMWNPSSRYRLVHILPASSSKPASDAPVVFFNEFYVKSSSRYSLVHILSTSWSKSGRPWQSFNIFKCKTELSLQSCALFSRQLLQIEARNRGNRDPGSHFTRTKRWVSCPRIFSNLNSCVPDLLHFPTTWWWCGWLTWWCDWHDGENAGSDNRP